MNTANKLTVIRVLMIPIFLIVLYINFPASRYVAMGIFILAGLTDIADGHIARTRNEVTDFGKLMDPLADKILVLSAMLWFLDQGLMPVWVVLIVVVREFLVTALRMIAVENGRVIAAGFSGKIKTVVTMICLAIMFLNLEPWMIYVCLALITFTTVFSGVEYFIKNKDIFNWKKL